MNIKKTYMIKGKPWKIEYKWGLKSDGEMVDGLCEYDTRTIWLRREISRYDKIIAFLHEWGHAICHEAHLGEDGGVGGFAEEVVVAAYADAIYTTWELRHKKGAP